MRLIFAGTPEFAAHHLQVLIDSEHEIVAVYTQPDRPAGRGKKLLASPVKELALNYGLPVYQPASLKGDAEQRELQQLHADVMVVVAYGLLLPQAVLDAPKYGCINVHASLLPRWRGAAPIQRALAAGDRESGITIMQMDIGLDTGDMLVKTHCPITDDDTGGSLHDKLMNQGGPALLQALQQIHHGTLQPQVQDDSLACYAAKLSKEEAELDWQLPASELQRRIRAFNPFPVSYFTLGSERLRVWQAHTLTESGQQPPGTVLRADANGIVIRCGDGSALALLNLQLPGKKALPVKDILNGHGALFTPGTRLGEH